MTAFVGTSGWQYKSWKGPFYPEKLPQRSWLEHYATRFPAVEVNNSFYMLPKEQTFDRWREISPPGFLFVVKASRYITHLRRMRNAKDSVNLFWSRAKRLEGKLGPILFQFPPSLRADVALLRDFLAMLPSAIAPAFEFRHDSWTNDETCRALDEAGAAWVLADRAGPTGPIIVTGGWSYIRFHWGREGRPGYTRSQLNRWADRIAELDAGNVWIFFNNDPQAAAPADAATLMDLLDKRGMAVATARG